MEYSPKNKKSIPRAAEEGPGTEKGTHVVCVCDCGFNLLWRLQEKQERETLAWHRREQNLPIVLDEVANSEIRKEAPALGFLELYSPPATTI